MVENIFVAILPTSELTYWPMSFLCEPGCDFLKGGRKKQLGG